jgi:hypothetical protein
MNGKPGDSPITDITLHGLGVYSPKADALIREIIRLGGRDQIEPMLLSEYSPYRQPDVPKLEGTLGHIRDQLFRDAKERGWEV